jgi:hypothetical protein
MKKLTLTIVLLLAATTASAGTLWTEWFDCNPMFKLYSVSWKGPWQQGATRNLESAPTNHGPWETVASDLAAEDCLTPATNLRWYRMRSCTYPIPIPPCFVDSNLLWVPQTLCVGNPNLAEGGQTS